MADLTTANVSGRADVLVVLGTRPEAAKLVSVVEALRGRGVAVDVALTGQHEALMDGALLARLKPDWALGVASDGRLPKFLHDAGQAVARLIEFAKPRSVLVQGDTASGYVAAKEAWRAGVPVAHVEAGVRSYALEPWPEEPFRVQMDGWATWRFAATAQAAANLAAEGLDSVVTGQTGLDVLREAEMWPRRETSPPTLLVTLHRRELRERADLADVLGALAHAVALAPVNVVWPVHPAMAAAAAGVAWPSNVALVGPMRHHQMVCALAGARGLLTDSGGLVEEAAWLGVPTAIWRTHNDRPEAVAAGVAAQFRVGAEQAADAVAWATTWRPGRARCDAYGDGRAGARVADALAAALGAARSAA